MNSLFPFECAANPPEILSRRVTDGKPPANTTLIDAYLALWHAFNTPRLSMVPCRLYNSSTCVSTRMATVYMRWLGLGFGRVPVITVLEGSVRDLVSVHSQPSQILYLPGSNSSVRRDCASYTPIPRLLISAYTVAVSVESYYGEISQRPPQNSHSPIRKEPPLLERSSIVCGYVRCPA